MEKSTNKLLDIVKGIGIVLVVVGHSGAPKELVEYIYLFHMPLFFFVSGTLFKEGLFNKPADFFKKRIVKYYSIYFYWSLFFLIIHNFLFKIFFYSTQVVSNSLAQAAAYKPHTTANALEEMFKILTLRGSEQLLGTLWFIKVLLVINILFFVSFYASNRRREFLRFILIFVLFIFALLYAEKNRSVDTSLFSSTLLTSSASLMIFYCGFLLKKYLYKFRFNIFTTLFSLISLYICRQTFGSRIDLATNLYPSLFIFVFSVVSGILLILNVSSFLSKNEKLSNLFSYIGKNSLAIMILHFTSFKLVNYLYLTANHLPTEWLSSFMTLHSNNNLWTAYVLVGIAIPIIINSIYRRIIQLFSARKKKAYSLAKI